MARYSLFVLKVPLNPNSKQTNKQYSWLKMQFIYITYTFIYITAESEGEKKLKIGQHLPKLWAIK